MCGGAVRVVVELEGSYADDSLGIVVEMGVDLNRAD